MAVLEINKELLIVDCGVLFPDETQPGVDLILPDFEPIRDRLDQISAMVITHGHEDHIGAIPYLLRERPDIPIYSGRLTLALIANKLKEFRISGNLIPVSDREIIRAGEFEVQFLAVTHSIPDAYGLFIKTVGGNIVHSGDYKNDPTPLDGRVTDIEFLTKAGDLGVDLLMIDSTGAEYPGVVESERTLAPVLNDLVAKAPGRIIVASFASHIHRVQQIINAAEKNGRNVALLGRSMVNTQRIARELGYLKARTETLINIDDVDSLPDNKVIVICTGSQGEPLAALSRIANSDHKLSISPGDTVILASSLVPGNETAVNNIINKLIRQGAEVIHKGNAEVHVSGHGSAGELIELMQVVRPKNVMAVHGEHRHQVANQKLATSIGVTESRIIVADNGAVIDLKKSGPEIVGQVDVGIVFVDGSSVGELAETSLTDRRILGEEGFISIFVAVDLVAGKVIAGPELHARGFAEDDSVFDDVIPQIVAVLETALAAGTIEARTLAQLVRRTTGKWVASRHSRRPMIVPVVVEA
jgi:ribonuclease J